MVRKLTLFAIGIVALSSLLLVIAPSQDAQAQCTVEYNGMIINSTGCLNYPTSGFVPKSTPVPTATPGPTSAAVVSADSVTATTGGGTGGAGAASIAFTGSESKVLGYVGAGLVGFGSIALVVARRKSDSDLD